MSMIMIMIIIINVATEETIILLAKKCQCLFNNTVVSVS